MGEVVYADLLFLVNFSMDFLCAYLALTMLRRRAVPWRVIGASTFGAIYAVAALFWNLPRGWAVAADLAACLLMCVLLFGARGVPFRFFVLGVFVFVLVSMAMGGMMTALFNLLNHAWHPSEMWQESGGEDNISAWLFALLAGGSALLSLRGGHLLRRSATRRFARLTVTAGERTVEVQALIDSGNLCRDPISGRAVVFVSPERVRALFGGREAQDPELARRFRLVPVETVGGKRLQKAYLPDRVLLRDSGGTHEADVLIAPAETLRGAGVYEAIVPAEVA